MQDFLFPKELTQALLRLTSTVIFVIWATSPCFSETDSGALYDPAEVGDLGSNTQVFDPGPNISLMESAGHQPTHPAAQEGHLEIARFESVASASTEVEMEQDWSVARSFEKAHQGDVAQLLNSQRDEAPFVPVVQALTMPPPVVVITDMEAAVEQLFHAVSRGEAKKITSLLDGGVPIEAMSKQYFHGGRTVLSLAASEMPSSRVWEGVGRVLLKRKANVSARDASGRTPLHYAAEKGNTQAVHDLLEFGAAVDAQDDKGETPLFSAMTSELINKHNSVMIAALLDHGANPNLTNTFGESPLHQLVRSCRPLPAVELLLSYKAVPDHPALFGTELSMAARCDDDALLRIMLENGVTPNLRDEDGKTALHHASMEGRLNVAQLLLDRGADLDLRDAWGNSALALGISGQHVEIVTLLLQHGALLHPNENTAHPPLYYATTANSTRLVSLLIAEGAKPDFPSAIDGTTALHWAAYRGYTEVARVLLKANATVNARSFKGWTPLHEAAINNQKPMVLLLIDSGALLNAQADDSQTPLHFAAEQGHGTIVCLLLERGAKVDERDNLGRTPYDLAVTEGNRSVARYLSRGATPLRTRKGGCPSDESQRSKVTADKAPRSTFSEGSRTSVTSSSTVAASKSKSKPSGPAKSHGDLAQLPNPKREDPILQIQQLVKSVTLEMTQSGKYLVTASVDGIILVWELSTGRQVASFRVATQMLTALIILQDERRILTKALTTDASLWDLVTGKKLMEYSGSNLGQSIFLTPDERYIVVAGDAGDNTLYDLSSGKQIRNPLWNKDQEDLDQSIANFPFTERMTGATVSPNKRAFVSVGYDEADVWTMSDWKRTLRVKETAKIVKAAYSDNGGLLAILDSKGRLKVYKAGNLKPLWSLRFAPESIHTILPSPDGRLLFVSLCKWEDDCDIQVFKLASGDLIRTFTGNAVPAVSQDSRFLVSVDAKDMNQLHIWDIRTKKLRNTLVGRGQNPVYLGMSDDEQLVVTGNEDGQIVVWDLKTGTAEMLPKLQGAIVSHVGALEVTSPSSRSNNWTGGVLVLETTEDRTRMSEEGDLGLHLLKPYDLILQIDGRDVRSVGDFQRIDQSLIPGKQVDLEVVRDDRRVHLQVKARRSEAAAILQGLRAQDNEHLKFLLRYGDGTVRLRDKLGKNELVFRSEHNYLSSGIVASNGQLLVTLSVSAHECVIWNLMDGGRLLDFPCQSEKLLAAVLENRHILDVIGDREVIGIDLDKRETAETALVSQNTIKRIRSAAVSKDGKVMAIGGDDRILIWNFEAMTRREEIILPDSSIAEVGLSPDGKFLVTESWLDGSSDQHTMYRWDLSALHREVPVKSSFIGRHRFLSLTADNRNLFSLSGNNISLSSQQTGKELLQLYSFTNETWAVAITDMDRAGRFDTNTLEEIPGLHWVLPTAPLHALPIESFMTEYYEPRLLPRVLQGDPFPPIRPLTSLNIQQPIVAITSVIPEPGRPNRVSLTVSVSEPTGKCHRSGAADISNQAYNLRVFRDGQLVAYAPESDGPLPIASGQSTWTHTFHDIRIPFGLRPKPIEFTAYAFNCDQVRSPLAKRIYETTPRSHSSAVPRGKAYVISVGVNEFQNSAWNLEFSINDAQAIQDLLVPILARSGRFREVVPLMLTSPPATSVGSSTAAAATRANIETILARMAGKRIAEKHLQTIPGFEQLSETNPEDTVVLFFSTHGYRNDAGKFFIFPHDLGQDKDKTVTDDLLAHTISSEDLSRWLRDVDAGELILLIDACYSKSAVQGANDKLGPFGSRGLGQLSYDKAMRVLAASEDKARGVREEKKGLLTLALKEGLDKKKADFDPPNDIITVGEWLKYALMRVPSLDQELFSRPEKLVPIQQPALFDFSKKRRVEDPILWAR